MIFVGTFEESKEGISIASDVKVQGWDPDTLFKGRQGAARRKKGMSAISNRRYFPLGSLLMNPWDLNNSPIQV